MSTTVYSKIASTVIAYQNCVKSGNQEWELNHLQTIRAIESDCLPHGSGFDSGCHIYQSECTDDKLVIGAPYHCMNDNGYYDGWEEYIVTVRPSLAFGITVSVKGKSRNGTNDYVAEVLAGALQEQIA